MSVTAVVFLLLVSQGVYYRWPVPDECKQDMNPCIAFVMGVVEGARHQTRERLNAQPYAFLVHGEPVCLPSEWNSQNLTSVVLSILRQSAGCAPILSCVRRVICPGNRVELPNQTEKFILRCSSVCLMARPRWFGPYVTRQSLKSRLLQQ